MAFDDEDYDMLNDRLAYIGSMLHRIADTMEDFNNLITLAISPGYAEEDVMSEVGENLATIHHHMVKKTWKLQQDDLRTELNI